MRQIIEYWETELVKFDEGFGMSYATNAVCVFLVIAQVLYRIILAVSIPVWILPYMIHKAMEEKK